MPRTKAPCGLPIPARMTEMFDVQTLSRKLVLDVMRHPLPYPNYFRPGEPTWGTHLYASMMLDSEALIDAAKVTRETIVGWAIEQMVKMLTRATRHLVIAPAYEDLVKSPRYGISRAHAEVAGCPSFFLPPPEPK